jgi:putative membrane-bound dehydrogenase-like protein
MRTLAWIAGATVVLAALAAGAYLCWSRWAPAPAPGPEPVATSAPAGNAPAEAESLRIAPLEPAKANKTFRALDGFRMDLLAAEPQVTSPVALAYDEDGRAYVVEMCDYPYTDKSTDKPFTERTGDRPLGRIRLLDQPRPDGTFARSTVFAEGLSWPTGLACWKGGIFVTATPDIWYLKSTRGDGKADVRVRVFTGFRKFNVQAVINNLKWGLDHHIYAAGGTNGGAVRPGAQPGAKPIPLAAADFRIDPVTEQFELLSGGARFGNTFDDWGNRFLCNIRNPVQHVLLPRDYLARNPFVPVRSPLIDAAEAGDTLAVFRASPPEPWRVLNAGRLARDRTYTGPRSESNATGYFTSACGVTIYRGAAYPPRYYGNAFLGEVAGNLVHRQVLASNGVTFTARRADAGVEFVASTDNWFRPVNFVNAPDGTLHVVDMYRETIEHPWSIPNDIKARLDLESGRDRGRIYRLAPPGFRPGLAPRLGSATTEQLVGHLQNPNSWWRETAHRLLFERQDPAAVPPLRKLLADGKDGVVIDPVTGRDVKALARLHALWSLDGLKALEEGDLLAALSDASPGIREHAVRLAEPRLARSPALRDRVRALAADPDLRVRFQVAFSLGAAGPTEAVTALARIARRDAGDAWLRIAVLCSSRDIAAPLLLELLNGGDFLAVAAARNWFRDLARVVAGRGQLAEVNRVLSAAAELPAKKLDMQVVKAVQYAIAVGLGDGFKRSGKALAGLRADSKSPAGNFLAALWQEAEQTAGDGQAAVAQRTQAIELLGYAPFARARAALTALLESRQPREVQAAAVRTLAGFPGPEVPAALLGACRSLTPEVRREVVEALLSRPAWVPMLLDAVEARTISRGEIPLNRKQLLLRHRDEKVRNRAAGLFGLDAIGPRKEVVAQYRAALSLPGDRARGQIVFRRECTACHRLHDEGHEVGPNLATVLHHSPAEVMLAILDPNREVSPNYLEYTVQLTDGRVTSGVIAGETATTITLRRAEGRGETILRRNIEEITGTGRSLMPEGLEKTVTVQEMADLLAFLLRK